MYCLRTLNLNATDSEAELFALLLPVLSLSRRTEACNFLLAREFYVKVLFWVCVVGFGSGVGAAEAAPVRSCQKLPRLQVGPAAGPG